MHKSSFHQALVELIRTGRTHYRQHTVNTPSTHSVPSTHHQHTVNTSKSRSKIAKALSEPKELYKMVFWLKNREIDVWKFQFSLRENRQCRFEIRQQRYRRLYHLRERGEKHQWRPLRGCVNPTNKWKNLHFHEWKITSNQWIFSFFSTKITVLCLLSI